MVEINNKTDGYTIVELVVTIVVGAIFAIAVTTVSRENAHLSKKARDLVTINSFAQGEMETLRSIGYLSLNTGTTDISAQLPSSLHSPRSASLTITTPEDGIKKAELSISYNDQRAQKTYSYSSFIGELGVGQY